MGITALYYWGLDRGRDFDPVDISTFNRGKTWKPWKLTIGSISLITQPNTTRTSCRYGSWTRDSSGIDLRLQGSSADTSSYIENFKWELVGAPAKRNAVQYDCCPETYLDITYDITLKKKF